MPLRLGRFAASLRVSVAMLLASCLGNESTAFPPGLEPLEDNTAPRQDGGAIEPGIEFVDGDNGSWAWVHGRGYLAGTPAEVWATLKDPELMAAVCSTDSHSFETGVEPDYEHSFELSYFVDDVINIEWDELWRYGTIEGTQAAPALGMVRYQKVWGSELIYTLEGSIQLHALEAAGFTEVQFVEHLAAAGGDLSDIRQSMQQRYDSVVSVLAGGVAPPCP
jgi:hypothetical protein